MENNFFFHFKCVHYAVQDPDLNCLKSQIRTRVRLFRIHILHMKKRKSFITDSDENLRSVRLGMKDLLKVFKYFYRTVTYNKVKEFLTHRHELLLYKITLTLCQSTLGTLSSTGKSAAAFSKI